MYTNEQYEKIEKIYNDLKTDEKGFKEMISLTYKGKLHFVHNWKNGEIDIVPFRDVLSGNEGNQAYYAYRDTSFIHYDPSMTEEQAKEHGKMTPSEATSIIGQILSDKKYGAVQIQTGTLEDLDDDIIDEMFGGK